MTGTAALMLVAAMVFSCASNTKTSTGSKIKNVAIVEAEVDAQSGADAQLNPAEVRQITAVLRKEAVKNLPQGKYNIMTTETVMSQGSAVLEECFDENCVIKVGAAIGADYIVRGTVSKFGNMLTVSVDMYETNDGNLVASSELVRSENIVELLDKTAGASGEMYRKFENPNGAKTKQAVAYQTPTPKPKPTPMPKPAPKPIPTPNLGIDGSDNITDGRNGKIYKAVVINGKRWMAENLNFKIGDSWCREAKDSGLLTSGETPLCDKYGRIYNWNTARIACPVGWHLPSRQEWDNLEEAAGGSYTAGTKLKSRRNWNGTDDYGFSGLFGSVSKSV